MDLIAGKEITVLILRRISRYKNSKYTEFLTNWWQLYLKVCRMFAEIIIAFWFLLFSLFGGRQFFSMGVETFFVLTSWYNVSLKNLRVTQRVKKSLILVNFSQYFYFIINVGLKTNPWVNNCSTRCDYTQFIIFL